MSTTQASELPFDEETKSPPVTPAVIGEFAYLNIYQKINYVSSQVQPLKKSRQVSKADGSLDYASTNFEDILTVINPLLDKVGLVILPLGSTITRSGKLTEGHYTYKLVNTDNPSEVEIVEADSQGYDVGDKGANKASTAAMKYLFMRLFRLQTADLDPDHISNDVYQNADYPQHHQNPQQAAPMQQHPQYVQQPVQQQQQQPIQQQPPVQHQQQPVQQQQQPIQQMNPQLNASSNEHQQEILIFKDKMQEIERLHIPVDSMLHYLSTQRGGVDFRTVENLDFASIQYANLILQNTIDTTLHANGQQGNIQQ